jgi:dTDP-L-rhamnose 4-epimerase
MKVLVTGSGGFIGRRVAEQLAAAGDSPVDFDVALDSRDDITDLDRVRDVITGCEVVVHLAAKVGLGVDLRDLDGYARTNDLGTAVVLRAAAEGGVGRVVFASSMVVYGDGRYLCARHGIVQPAQRNAADLAGGRFEPSCPRCGAPLEPGLTPEDAPLDPRNGYAATKVHGEHLGTVWATETGRPFVALRFHNVYGPGLPRHTPYAGVAALFASSLDRNEPPQVFEDGRQRRNFVHVDDVARAVVAATRAPLPGGITAVNVGSPWVITIGELAAHLSRTVDGPAPVVTGRFRLGDVRHITADCRAAETVLGWRARFAVGQPGVSVL